MRYVEAEGLLAERGAQPDERGARARGSCRLRRELERRLKNDPEMSGRCSTRSGPAYRPAGAASAVLARGAIMFLAPPRAPTFSMLRPVRVGKPGSVFSPCRDMRRAIRSFACVVGLSAKRRVPPSRLPRTASLPRSHVVPVAPPLTAAGWRTLPVFHEPSRSPSPPGRPAGNRSALAEVRRHRRPGGRDGAGSEHHDRRRRREHRLVPRRGRFRFRRGAESATVPAGGDGVLDRVDAFLPGTTQIAWKPFRPEPRQAHRRPAAGPVVQDAATGHGPPGALPDGATIAFANANGLATIAAAGGDPGGATTRRGQPAVLARLHGRVVHSPGMSCARLPRVDGGQAQVLLSAGFVPWTGSTARTSPRPASPLLSCAAARRPQA